jgi:16S rRNA (guanine(1405)-N(7))-methyltransferase
MEDRLINIFLIEIKKNKKYSTLADEIVIEEIKEYLEKNKEVNDINRQSIKEIRKSLHRLYSSYIRGKKSKKTKLLDELKDNPDDPELIKKILSTSLSSKERLKDYKDIYKQIFILTGKPKSILDLGCGLNPLSFIFMDLDCLEYHAYDIDTEDIGLLNNFFKTMKDRGLNGSASILNIKNLKDVLNLPRADMVFLWKIIDLINTKNDKPGEELIKILMKKTDHLVVSFSTKTLSGKNMFLPRRKGFEMMLKRIGLSFDYIKFSNEIFYVIKTFQVT